MDHEPDTSQSGYDCDSPLPTRNPSPPPELRDNEEAMADIIQGTMISKEWIFSIFLKLIEVRAHDLCVCVCVCMRARSLTHVTVCVCVCVCVCVLSVDLCMSVSHYLQFDG